MGSQLPLPGAAAATGAALPETGVYVGIQQMEYAALAAPHLHSFGPYNASGSPFSVAAGRLSFTYGLKGESALHQYSSFKRRKVPPGAEPGVTSANHVQACICGHC